MSNMQGINPTFFIPKIFMEEGNKSSMQHQRRLNPLMKEVVRKKVIKWLDANIVYPISDNRWVSPI